MNKRSHWPGVPRHRLEDYPPLSTARLFLVRHERRFQDLGGSVEAVRETVCDELAAVCDLLTAYRLPTRRRELMMKETNHAQDSRRMAPLAG